MRKLFSPLSAPRSPLLPRRSNGDINVQLRASLEGLEVRDSTWDEWLACQQAQAQAQPRQPSSVK